MALTRSFKKTIKARIARDPIFAKRLSGGAMRSTGVKLTKGTATKKRKPNIDVTIGSGNVFADLGFEHPEEDLARAQLAHCIWTIIHDRKLTKARAGKIMGLDGPNVTALLNGRSTDLSIDRLMRLLTMLGKDVDVVVRHARKGQEKGALRVLMRQLPVRD